MEEESMTSLTLSTNSNHICGPKNGILPGELYQYFAFPDAIMHYIAMNPSNAQVYKKLIQTCKYFFNKNPILVVSGLFLGGESGYEWKVSLNEASNTLTQKETEDYFDRAPKKKLDMKTLPCKLWVTQYVSIFPHRAKCEQYVASIIPKLYRCDAYCVEFNDQVLTLDELLLLASNVSKCILWTNTITKNDGKDEVAFEKVIEKLTKLREIRWICTYPCECLSGDTVKELLKIPHFGNISSFTIEFITHERFDAKALFDYVKTQNKNMKVYLTYSTEESSAKFKKQIQEIVDEVIGTDVFNYMPPLIYDYHVIEREKRLKMQEISDRYANTRFLISSLDYCSAFFSNEDIIVALE